MTEHELSPEQHAFSQWLETLDLEKPLAELVEHLDVDAVPQFAPEELERLEALGREYAQELVERDAIPDLPAMDMDEHLLDPTPEHLIVDHDHDRDR